MLLFHPSVQAALVAYGVGAVLAGGLTFAMDLGEPWPLLGSGAGPLICAGALRLMRRTLAMQARTLEELQFRRVVLGIGTLAASFGIVVFALALIRWQFDLARLRLSPTRHVRSYPTSRKPVECPTGSSLVRFVPESGS